MIKYKHTQIGYLMLIATLAVLILFTWIQITARLEPPSADSGTNFAVTAIMTLILLTLLSFSTLTVLIDDNYLKIKFGYGIFIKKFPLDQIVSVKSIKNPWYYGWGIRLWLWPRKWIYNVSGFDAVEIILKNKKNYIIGTNVPEELKNVIKQSMEKI